MVDDLPVEDWIEEEDEEEDDALSAEDTSTDDDRAPAARHHGGDRDESDEDGGRRRRRGRRGGRRVREEGERDGFTWVRGRTPSLTDPYVWFDPINPESEPASAMSEAAETAETESHGATPQEERDGRRRRRRRGRGRDRGVEAAPTRAEARAEGEGMIEETPVDEPMAVSLVETDSETQTPVAVDAAPAEDKPRRRRVRRKTTASEDAPVADVEPKAESGESPDLAAAEPPLESIAQDQVEVEVEADEAAEPAPAPVATEPPAPPRRAVDVADILASDPNQITTPPAKPKRGWWRL